MARTWPVTRRKRLALGAFDAVAGPVARLFGGRAGTRGEVDRILVLELWHMGDVVLATPALARLRAMYPGASITLLAKEHAKELLRASALVDDIVTFDFPWTATSGKYRPGRYDRAAIAALTKELRDRRFDLCLDCRMDIRSNFLTRSIGASRRVGYDFGGGGFLLTDALPPPPASQHKVDDWMGLLAALERDSAARPPTPDPQLVVTDEERAEAKRVLESHDISPDAIVIGIHAGGSHEAKRWAPDSFARVGRELSDRYDASILAFVDPDGYGSDMQLGPEATFVRTSIREMMALLTHCDVLLCNDSGPMHVAAALGVPVVAVFRTGDPAAYGPRGLDHTVVGSGAPPGRTVDVSLDDVRTAADAALSRIDSHRRVRAESRP